MATQLDKFTSRQPLPRYPWHEWEDGKPWRVVRGKDFACTLQNFQHSLFRRARELGIAVKTSLDRETGSVTFQFYDPGSPCFASP